MRYLHVCPRETESASWRSWRAASSLRNTWRLHSADQHTDVIEHTLNLQQVEMMPLERERPDSTEWDFLFSTFKQSISVHFQSIPTNDDRGHIWGVLAEEENGFAGVEKRLFFSAAGPDGENSCSCQKRSSFSFRAFPWRWQLGEEMDQWMCLSQSR